MKALDHDMAPEALLVPFGVLEMSRGAVPIHQPWFRFGHSRETSDFLADGLDLWWGERKAVHPGVAGLHIELGNGPEIASSRTQFLKRMVAFVDWHRVAVERVYLPPYHSKYNPIERCWGILERHWDGALLSSVADILRWAGTMTYTRAVAWSGVACRSPVFVHPLFSDPLQIPLVFGFQCRTQRSRRGFSPAVAPCG